MGLYQPVERLCGLKAAGEPDPAEGDQRYRPDQGYLPAVLRSLWMPLRQEHWQRRTLTVRHPTHHKCRHPPRWPQRMRVAPFAGQSSPILSRRGRSGIDRAHRKGRHGHDMIGIADTPGNAMDPWVAATMAAQARA